MSIEKITSLEDALNVTRLYPVSGGFGHWYRGQANSTWEPVPRAFRPPCYVKGTPVDADLFRFIKWRSHAIAYTNTLPLDDLDCLAFAQHHGLATRLLDWTGNLFAAIYFAAADEPQADGAVFVFKTKKTFTYRSEPLGKILDMYERFKHYDDAMGYLPPAVTQRILVQKAGFTVHRCPEKPYGTKELPIKLIVPADNKKKLLFALEDYGVNHATLFPDIDGYSRYQNWLFTEYNKLGTDTSHAGH